MNILLISSSKKKRIFITIILKTIFMNIPNSKSSILLLLLISFIFLGCSSNENTEENNEEQLSISQAETMLNLVNEARSDAGLNTLVLNNALNDAAYKHSLDMNTNDFFSHTGSNGSTFGERATDAEYAGFAVGENIAHGQTTAQSAFNSWMNSSGHKANILNKNATEMGLGVSNTYWTQIFGIAK